MNACYDLVVGLDRAAVRPASRSAQVARAALSVGVAVAVAGCAPTGQSVRQSGAQLKAPSAFVALTSVDPTIRQDMRYTTVHNFVGDRIDGYQEPVCILTRPAAEALQRAQTLLLVKGYSLKAYDCYRPQQAVDQFVRWAQDLDDTRMKGEYYPNVAKDRLLTDGYIAAKSGHSRGSTVDVTLVKLSTEPPRADRPGQSLVPRYASQNRRLPDNSVDMGTGFDFFDTRSHTDDPRITDAQKANRVLLRSALTAEGFSNLPEEWWHFTYQHEPFPTTHFDFPVARDSLAESEASETEEPKPDA